jgi:hypothetical protein
VITDDALAAEGREAMSAQVDDVRVVGLTP